MKYIKIEKINVIINLLILVFLISGSVIAKAEESVKPTNKQVLPYPPTPHPSATSSPVKPTSPIIAIDPRLSSMKKGADYSIKEPLWVDTENKIGPKVFVDLNSQYYYYWGQVYTVKYTNRMGKTEYVQIELKGLRGNRAAILSVDSEYKNIYEIPIHREYKSMTPDKAIYNSTKIINDNTQKPTCPEYKCVIKKY